MHTAWWWGGREHVSVHRGAGGSQPGVTGETRGGPQPLPHTHGAGLHTDWPTCYHAVSQSPHSHDRPLQYFLPHLTHMALVTRLSDPHAGMWQLPSLVPSHTQLLTAMLPITNYLIPTIHCPDEIRPSDLVTSSGISNPMQDTVWCPNKF